MKTIKKTKIESPKKKKPVKKFNPAFVVDLTGDLSMTEIYAKFGLAKQRAGLAISDTEFEAIVSLLAQCAADFFVKHIFELPCTNIRIDGDEKLEFDSNGKFRVKKPNIFKRFWNWIRRK